MYVVGNKAGELGGTVYLNVCGRNKSGELGGIVYLNVCGRKQSRRTGRYSVSKCMWSETKQETEGADSSDWLKEG